MKKVMCLAMILLMVLGLSTSLLAADPNARTISIYKNEGASITMTKGTAKQFAAQEGLKLFDGYTVATGKDSYSYLKMDEDSLLKMNEKSEIAVSKLSGNKLSVAVRSGGIAVNAAAQKPGDTLEIRAGNSALAIRGTIFTAEYIETDEFETDGFEFVFIITMLTGQGEVDGKQLKAGQTMYVYDKTINRIHEIRETRIDSSMSLFTLQTIWEFREEILAAGTFTEQEINRIPALIEQKKNQPRPADIVITNDVNYYEQPTASGGGGGGSAPPPPTGSASLYFGGGATGTPYATVHDAYVAAQAPGGAGSTITVTGAATIDAGDTISVGGTDNLASLTVGSTATLAISGILDVGPGGTLTNDGNITISGTGSASELNARNGGQVINNGTITNSSNTITIEDGMFINHGTLNNTASPQGQIVLQGTSSALLDNQGVFNNAGIIDSINMLASFSNSATFSNSGTFNNSGMPVNNWGAGTTANSGTITGNFYNSATFDNTGSVIVPVGYTFENSGSFNNQAGGNIFNSGDFNNQAGDLSNNGAFENLAGATFHNNNGTLINNGAFGNQAAGIFDNTNGIFTNSGSFGNQTGGTFDNTNGTISGNGDILLEPGSNVLGLDFSEEESGLGGDDLDTVAYVWNPHAIVTYEGVGFIKVVQSVGAFTAARFTLLHGTDTTYYWGIQGALKNAVAGDIIEAFSLEGYGQEYEAYAAYINDDYETVPGLDLSGSAPPPPTIVIPAGVTLKLTDGIPFGVSDQYGDFVLINHGEIDVNYAGLVFLDSTVVNEASGVISLVDSMFETIYCDFTNKGKIVIKPNEDYFTSVDSVDSDWKGDVGASIEFSNDFGPGSAWHNPTTCKFYDSAKTEILPNGNESIFAGKIIAWDADAGGAGVAGWLEQ